MEQNHTSALKNNPALNAVENNDLVLDPFRVHFDIVYI